LDLPAFLDGSPPASASQAATGGQAR